MEQRSKGGAFVGQGLSKCFEVDVGFQLPTRRVSDAQGVPHGNRISSTYARLKTFGASEVLQSHSRWKGTC